MARLLWLTDPHLNFSSYFSLLNFLNRLDNLVFDRLVITGDISDGFSLKRHITMLAKKVTRPISFVLGNHDFYGRCMGDVQNEVLELVEDFPHLEWLNYSDVSRLDSDSCLLGHDGWYDALSGSDFIMNYSFDFSLIKDFRLFKTLDEKLEEIRRMCNTSANILRNKIISNIEKYSRFFIATHVPPFQEAFDENQKFWLSYNTNTTMGKMISSLADLYPDKNFIVLSGHTHVGYTSSPKRNILNLVSDASYVGCSVSEHILDTATLARKL